MIQQEFDEFEANQKALALHQQMIGALYVPNEETLRFDIALRPLGFDYGGDFYPVEFPVEDYEWIEIGKCAITHTGVYIAVLNYSIMEYWEIHKNSVDLLEITIEAVTELES